MRKNIRVVVSIILSVIMVMTQSICVSADWHKTKNGDYYYTNERGKRVTGWKKIDGSYYYFDKDGYRYENGFATIDDNIYRFSSSGKMMTGWYKENDMYYYFKSDGKITTGWKKIDGKQYYFDPNDYHMCIGETYIDGKIYNFNSAGVWDGKAGYKSPDYRYSYWGDNVSAVSKKDTLVEGKKGSGLYFGKNVVLGDYTYYVYYNFDSKNKLYSGLYLLIDDYDNITDEFSCYLAYNQLVELYTAKYGTPTESGINYYSSTKDYAKKYLNTWEAVQYGYAYGKSTWKTNTTEITINYFESDDFTPNVSVTYSSLNYTPSSSAKVQDTSGI